MIEYTIYILLSMLHIIIFVSEEIFVLSLVLRFSSSRSASSYHYGSTCTIAETGFTAVAQGSYPRPHPKNNLVLTMYC